ncbi:plasmid partitioning protein [Streptomyces sp. NPDC048629]|uniref:ParB/RepB/Spo0J family partition protein n=1 Tax=Streptomyces sp. NPDC048629 TaxID=3154824 RepID=UPI00341CCA24
MSKSDLLGTGASFDSARRSSGRSERGRAKAIAQGDLPAYELIRLTLDRVSPTPLNPRRNFGTDEDKTRFGEELGEAQLSACVVITRAAYLKLWPEHSTRIAEADFVLVNGERRYQSARHVGLEALDFVVRDDLAASREDFIDHLLAENLEREDFDVIERARGVQQMVDICAEDAAHGSKSRAAARLKKSPGWVTQQLALLTLPDEIQQLLSSGKLPERDGRFLTRVAKDSPELSPADLLARLDESKASEAEKKAQDKEVLAAHAAAKRKEPSAQPFTAVKGPLTPTPDAPPSAMLTSVPAASGSGGAPVPEQRDSKPGDAETAVPEKTDTDSPAESKPVMVDVLKVPRVPWHDGNRVAELVFEKMTEREREVLLERLLKAHRAD